MPHDTHSESLQSSPLPEAGSEARLAAMILPAAAVLVTLALFAYAIVAGGKADHGPVRLVSGTAGPASGAGDFGPQAGWVENLSAELSLAGPGQARLPSQAPSFADLPSSARLPEFVVAELTDTGPSDVRLALAAPSAGQTGSGEAALVQEAKLDSLSIEFPANSTRIPRRELATIRRAAEIIKTLPEGTTVELLGHIAGTSASRKGAMLAKKRAEAVYTALLREKVSPARLSKIVGAPEQEARSEAQAEGRSSTMGGRRVEFRIVGPNVPWHKA